MKQYPKFKDWIVELLRRASTDLPEDVVTSLEQARGREEPGSAAHNVFGRALPSHILTFDCSILFIDADQ